MLIYRNTALFAAVALAASSLALQTYAEVVSNIRGETRFPTGDVWISQEKRIYEPKEADDARDVELPTGDVWISREKRDRR